MHLLLTRPRSDSEALAATLAARGVATTVAPLLDIAIPDGPPLDLTGVQGLLMTSANGVRAFAAREARRDLLVFAVGEATGAEARAAGFG
ncbi:MAG: uroporphyrinogen-III synthase, partial [Rhodospirillaceae bacterium]